MVTATQQGRGVLIAAAVLACLALAEAVAQAADWPATPRLPAIQTPVFPTNTNRLSDFGAAADGRTLNTAAFEKAIGALEAQGGGTVIVPAGIWLTGPFKLKSNINLHLDAGALIQFSGDHNLYPLVVLEVKGEREVDSQSPISGENLENIAITGSGVIDGAGDAWRPVKKGKMTESQWTGLAASGGVLNQKGDMWWPSREAMDGEELVERLRTKGSIDQNEFKPAHHFLRPKLLKLIGCRRLLLEGVTFQNSPNWALNPTLCTEVTVRDITVKNPWYSQNGDGLDLESCSSVVVRGCSFDVGDDAICVKSGKDAAGRRIAAPTENVLIENCVVNHGHGGFTIGSEMSGGVRNIIVNNCLFLGTDVGLRFKSTRGRGGVVENVFISNVQMTDIPAEAISFNLYYGGAAPLDKDGGLKNVKREMLPVSEETPQFRNIYIEKVVCRGAARAMVLQGLPEMPIRGIHLRDVSISAELGVTLMDAENISLRNVAIDARRGPAVHLFEVKNSTIDKLVARPERGVVVKASGTGNRGIIIRNTILNPGGSDLVLEAGATRDAFEFSEVGNGNIH